MRSAERSISLLLGVVEEENVDDDDREEEEEEEREDEDIGRPVDVTVEVDGIFICDGIVVGGIEPWEGIED